jgi:hypothetical protein
MRQTGWIAVALVGTAAVLWMLMGWPTGRPPRAAPSSAGGAPVDEALVAEPPPSEPEPPAAAAPPAAADPSAKPAPRAPSEPEPAPAANLPPPEKTGPVDELKARFANESRDPRASDLEKSIEAAFKNDDVPAALLGSIECRRSVCKVETRWSADRAIGFMSAFTRLLMLPPGSTTPQVFDTNLAVSPEGAPDANGVRTVDVYLARLAPAEPAR